MSRPARTARTRLVGALAAPAALLLGVVGCSSDKPEPATGVTARPTPIERLNTGSMELVRDEFCTLVPSAAVHGALDGTSTSDKSWRNGDRAKVEDDVADVVHEFGCSWSRGGTTASAWVFARAVSDRYARTVLTKTSQREGCKTAKGPSFGSPGQRQVCTLADGTRRNRLAGLFGDTWLTCEITAAADVPATELARRTNAWCVQVANASNTTN